MKSYDILESSTTFPYHVNEHAEAHPSFGLTSHLPTGWVRSSRRETLWDIYSRFFTCQMLPNSSVKALTGTQSSQGLHHWPIFLSWSTDSCRKEGCTSYTRCLTPLPL